jgi:hypothetical protein
MKKKIRKRKKNHDMMNLDSVPRAAITQSGEQKAGIQFIAILALEQMLDIHCRKHSR